MDFLKKLAELAWQQFFSKEARIRRAENARQKKQSKIDQAGDNDVSKLTHELIGDDELDGLR